ncbi:MAG: chemotaxis protein CheB [Anaerolineae bacterium]|nr:chemotaxis protein CheB [Anaerolineae bacterium]
MRNGYEIVVVGTSSGGTQVLRQIFKALTPGFSLPICVVQHLYPLQKSATIVKFHENCYLPIKEAEDKEPLVAGRIYVAPANYHLLIEDDRTLALSVDARVNFTRPSIDVLFESAVDVFGTHTIGIILTGANSDGAQGLSRIGKAGGITIVQDPESASAPSLPLSALAVTAVDHILPPNSIGSLLNTIAER